MSLINREALLSYADLWASCGEHYTAEDVIMMIKTAPTVDAVPVVRCEKCLYWQSGENECEKWEYCTFHNIGIGPHSFCSYGERKEGADNEP